MSNHKINTYQEGAIWAAKIVDAEAGEELYIGTIGYGATEEGALKNVEDVYNYLKGLS